MPRRIDDPDLAFAARLHSLANTLEAFPHLEGYRDCGCLRCRARTYSEIGYPTTTLGDGGSRSSDTTSSTERAAINVVHPVFGKLAGYPLTMDDLDEALAAAEGIVASVLAHSSTDDPIRPGTGPCVVPTCEHLCNPRKDPHNRLRSGLCPGCHQAWLRYQRRHPQAIRSAFLAWRAKELAPEPRTQLKGQHVASSATA